MEAAPYLMQKVSFCEDSFWEARSKSRRNLIFAVIISSVLLQFLDTDHLENQLFSVFCISSLYYFLVTKIKFANERVHRLGYNLLISTVCILGFLNFITITLGLFGEGDQLIVRVLLKRMNNGEIISPTLFLLILPLIATPGGMDVTWAKTVTAINFFLFIIHTCIVYQRGMDNGLITHPDDLVKLHPSCNCSPTTTYMRDIGIAHDMVIIIGLFYLCWTSCALAADIAAKYVNLLSAGRSGDLVLNHNLKNSIAGAACLLELDNQEQNGSVELRSRQKQILNQLYRTMRWCTMRQVMVDVADGTYQSVLSPIHMQSFLSAIADDNVGGSFTIRESNEVVSFDEQMVRLAMENAISNALVHGDGSPIVLGATMNHETNMIAMYVENQVPESSCITSEKLEEVCERARSNDRSLPFTPTAESISNHSDITSNKTDGRFTESFVSTKMNLSTRSGLRHIDVACGGAGGYFDLKLKGSEQRCVVLTCYFPARKPDANNQELSFQESHSKASFNVVSEGHSNLPSPTISEMPTRPLKVCAIDDSELICKGYQKLLLNRLGANIEKSVVCCPKTKAQVEEFIDNVMDSDICILDQHIELNGSNNTERSVLGTDIARELKGRGYMGLVLIRSANSSELDALEYMADGSVHATLGKAESHKDMAAKICVAYAQHKRKHNRLSADEDLHPPTKLRKTSTI